jgi:molybdopterin/thiamine biosynthesis adenylyltransferase
MVNSKYSERYSRQILFSLIGEDGQKKLQKGRVAVIGCGGLGSNITNSLARAGVGFIRIIDKDTVELSNLQRQLLFDEKDVEEKLPKALTAKSKLDLVNSDVGIEAIVDEVNKNNLGMFLQGVDLVLDGTDNFETRFLINEECVKNKIPWIYGSVAASYGMVCSIVPESGYCLKCIFKDLPADFIGASSGNVGILGSAVSAVASIQTTEALKILTGNISAITKGLIILDIWDLSLEIVEIKKDTGHKCPVCN